MDINEFLDRDQKKDLLRLLTCGSVDDGKSTLIGRLLFDSKKLYEDQLDALERDSKREGHAGEEIDYALLLDGLKAEREQGITIDVAYRYFSTAKRKFIIADTPGHEQYTRNMITGGSTANLAILLVDARKGVITQTKRHTFLVSLLGIKHVVLAVNKMDLVEYSKDVFEQICQDYRDFTTTLDIPHITFIPVSALKGENIVEVSTKMPWYHGQSMLEFLESVHAVSDRNFEDLRFPVQYIIRPTLDYRGFAGKVSSGVIRVGDEVMALPSLKRSKVTSILTSEGDMPYAFPPQSASFTLAGEIDISRGEMVVHPDSLPHIERHFEAMLVWMDEKPMDIDTQFYIKHTTLATKARIDKINYKVDVNTLEQSQADHFELNEIGRVVMTTTKPLLFDPYKKNRQTGSFILIDPITHNTIAVGMILDKVRSENLFSHYWNKPEATAGAFDEEGFFATGDLGYRDELGFLTLVGRKKDLIITDGYNVYPPVVERVLNSHAQVRESAVIGVLDDRRGEKVVAVVVPDGNPSVSELREHCRASLAGYQVPARFELVDELPRNTMGKILKRELRAARELSTSRG